MRHKKPCLLICSSLIIMMIVTLSYLTRPPLWGENVSGVTTHFTPHGKEIALTFDACGGKPSSSQFDQSLIEFLQLNHIKATLFINSRWIDSNLATFKALANDPLFEIGNHGTHHKPLSIDGKTVYAIEGTRSMDEAMDEILQNEEKIKQLTGKSPHFFRAGTAYYDVLAVQQARSHGIEIAGFSIISDEGATLPSQEVSNRISNAQPGDIIIAHMNHPESGTREGIINAIRFLRTQGYSFIHLSDAKDRLIQIP